MHYMFLYILSALRMGKHLHVYIFIPILRTLNRTYVNMKQKPIWNDLNPKAVTTDELFGFIHHATREWKDGK